MNQQQLSFEVSRPVTIEVTMCIKLAAPSTEPVREISALYRAIFTVNG